MLKLQELRTKQANIKRWELLKTYKWESDFETIEYISKITNDNFFNSRTIEELKIKIACNIEIDEMIENAISKQ